MCKNAEVPMALPCPPPLADAHEQPPLQISGYRTVYAYPARAGIQISVFLQFKI